MTQLTVEQAVNLAMQHQQAGRIAQAAELYQAALKMQPNNVDALHYFGLLLARSGRMNDGLLLIRQSIALRPDLAHFHFHLGKTLMASGQVQEAVTSLTRAAEIDPSMFEAHLALGDCLQSLHRLDSAVGAYRRALALRTGVAALHSALGKALKNQGKLDEALQQLARAAEAEPSQSAHEQNRIFTMWMSSRISPAKTFEAHRRWAERFADPLTAGAAPHLNDRKPDRRLRIGYVSPDFWRHVIGRYVEPVLTNHDHDSFEIFCYSDAAHDDDVTARIRASADTWRATRTLSDEQLAAQIRDDRIDILIDLTLHTAGNRLLVFARKPAPVQATYLASTATSGMRAIDYRITDPYLDPPGMTERFHTEKLIRLPDNFWNYPPPVDAPETNPLPASQRGFVTFGSLNNFYKINPEVIRVWSEVLAAVPHSRLTVLAKGGAENNPHIVPMFRDNGVPPERLDVIPSRSLAEYLRLYLDVDIGVDPFPCNGHTTTLDSLWMGVPVITLAGTYPMARAGVSNLANLGLHELIAQTPAQYVDIAAQLAADLPRLQSLRSGLRERMKRSPLLDPARFTRNLETAYRRMWRDWCTIQP